MGSSDGAGEADAGVAAGGLDRPGDAEAPGVADRPGSTDDAELAGAPDAPGLVGGWVSGVAVVLDAGGVGVPELVPPCEDTANAMMASATIPSMSRAPTATVVLRGCCGDGRASVGIPPSMPRCAIGPVHGLPGARVLRYTRRPVGPVVVRVCHAPAHVPT